MPAAARSAAESPSTPPSPRGDAEAPLHRERVLPGPGVWIAAVAIGAAMGLILVPLQPVVALVVSVLAIGGALVLVLLYSPVLEVSGGRFRMGRAQIDVELLGEPVALAPAQWALTIGQDFEPLAHHCVRGWTRTGLRVEVLDEEDPTTAWVASTRHPEDLALALRTAQQAASRAPGADAEESSAQ